MLPNPEANPVTVGCANSANEETDGGGKYNACPYFGSEHEPVVCRAF